MLLVLSTRVLGVDLFGTQVHGDLVLRGAGDGLLQALFTKTWLVSWYFDEADKCMLPRLKGDGFRTNLSKTHLFRDISGLRHSNW